MVMATHKAVMGSFEGEEMCVQESNPRTKNAATKTKRSEKSVLGFLRGYYIGCL